MKLISLNIWGGRIGDKLEDFFKRNNDVDIFLLQEVYHNASEKTNFDGLARNEIFSEINAILSSHHGYFAATEADEFGLAIFIKKEIVVEESGDIFVYRFKNAMVEKDGRTLGRNLQYLKVRTHKGLLNILNFHGLWNGQGKTDTSDRLEQSKMIIEFIKTLSGEVILAGDFNLKPDTESLTIIERQFGYKNLIKEFAVTSTRPPIYTGPERYADYVLISKEILVKDFRVLSDEVSDHSPLHFEFE